MTFRAAVLTAAVVALTVASRSARAQRSTSIGIAASEGIPVGMFRNQYQSGTGILATIAMGSPDTPVGLRLDGSYNQFTGRDVGGVRPGKTTVAEVSANVVGTLPEVYGAKPYAIAGAGVYPYRSPVTHGRVVDFGLNGGLGFTFGVGPISGFAEVRYHRVFKRKEAARFVPINIGFIL